MTALSGPILFNNSTGSDSAASGCGPATAVNVTIQTTGGSNTATASWTGTISVGDLMYIPDAAFLGRRYNVIASVGSGSLTFDENWDDSSLGTAGYVGGKRAGGNLSTDAIFTEAPDGAVIEIEYTGTDYDNTTNIVPQLGSLAGGAVTIKGTGSQAPRIGSPTINLRLMDLSYANYLIFENLQFIGKKTNGGGIPIIFRTSNSANVSFRNCTLKSEQSFAGGSMFYDSANGPHVGFFENCIFDGNNLAAIGFQRVAGTYIYAPQILTNCVFKNTTAEAIQIGDSVSSVIQDCVIYGTGGGVVYAADAYWQNLLEGNIFYSISGDGVSFNNDDTFRSSLFRHNIFSSVTGNAFTSASVYATRSMAIFDNNAFHSIGGSNYNNLTAGSNDITLGASPFVDPTASPPDFNLNNALSGGATLRSTKFTLGG